MSNTASVQWSISGSYITYSARDLLLEGYRKAYNYLHEVFPTMTAEQINCILKGEKCLTGENDLDYVDENQKVKLAHEEEMKALTDGIFYKNNNYYEPYLKVTNYGEHDLDDQTSSYMDTFGRAVRGRANHYKNDVDDIIMHTDEHAIICRIVHRDLPIWINDKDLTFDACIGDAILIDIGHDELYTDSLINKEGVEDIVHTVVSSKGEELSEVEEMNRIKNEIAEQAKVDGYIDITTREGKHIATVPKGAFYQWAVARIRINHNTIKGLPKWTPVSESGMKLANDCAFHTDWLLGGGFELGDYYDDDELSTTAFRMLRKVQEELLKFESVVLASNKSGHAVGNTRIIRDAGDARQVEAGDIIVIPNAGVDFTEAFLKATSEGGGGVICEIGNKVAHLCKIAREQDTIIMQEDGCMDKYGYALVSLDSTKGIIEVID